MLRDIANQRALKSFHIFRNAVLKVKISLKILAKYFEPLQIHRAILSNCFSLLQHPDADSLYVEEIDVGEESMCKSDSVHSNDCLTT